MTSRRGRARRGSLLISVLIIVAVLVPLSMILVRNMWYQNIAATKDKNMGTSRELAGASTIDYLRTFAADYNRDYFVSTYLNRNSPIFQGLGRAVEQVTGNGGGDGVVRKTFRIRTRGEFAGGRANKGTDALIQFRQDLTRFSMYWNFGDGTNVNNSPILRDVGATGDMSFSGSIWINAQQIYFQHPMSSHVTFSGGPIFLEGNAVLIQTGNFVGPLTLFCRSFRQFLTPVGSTPNLTVRSHPPTLPAGNPLWGNSFPDGADFNNPMPRLAIKDIDPGEHGDGLQYYTRRQFNYKLQTNRAVDLRFFNNAGVDTVAVTTGPVYDDPSSPSTLTGGTLVENYALPAGPVSFVIDGSPHVHVRVDPNYGIPRRLTLTAINGNRLAETPSLQGTEVVILSDLRYLDDGIPRTPVTTAQPNSSLAVLTDGRLRFGAGVQQAVGFYYVGNLEQPGGAVYFTRPSDEPLTINGSVWGVPKVKNVFNLTITPDPQLAVNYPPLLPMRPAVVNWDYVAE